VGPWLGIAAGAGERAEVGGAVGESAELAFQFTLIITFSILLLYVLKPIESLSLSRVGP